MRLKVSALFASGLLLAATACQEDDGEAAEGLAPEPQETDDVGASEDENGANGPEAPSMRDLDVETALEEHVFYTPDDVEWEDGPGSFDEGAQMAAIEGHPSEEGFFNLHIKMPDGFVINPHIHPNVERVTVLQGTFNLGMGEEEVAPEATTALPEGSYVSMPPGMPHFAIAEGETIIQLTSIGPWEIEYLDPEDDPRE